MKTAVKTVAVLGLLLGLCAVLSAQTAPATGPAGKAAVEAMDAGHAELAARLTKGGVAFLLSREDKDGGWSTDGKFKPAITAIVVKALLQAGYGIDSPEVKRGMEALMKFRQKDGGFYTVGEGVENYSTALAVMTLAAAKDPQQAGALRDAVAFLKGRQIVAGSESPDGQKVTEEHPFAGGVTYGKHGRPDLSNVGMWMEALHEAGVPGDDPAMQRALTFVTRTQNRSESNPLAWVKDADNDGGFIYAPAIKDGKTPQSFADDKTGLRSYGSMTYVGFKSMLYANVAKDDPRIQAAYKWIRSFWRLDSNPNMPETKSLQGLYYYYHMFAKALVAWGQPVIKDVEGKDHNWRQELIDTLAQRVKADGSWTNQADRWMENNPVLVTGYAVLALQETTKK